jgi:hypothetical protein
LDDGGFVMAKNETQKILKALIYICIEKKYTIEMYGTKRCNVFLSNDATEIWKGYRHFSKGYIHIFNSADILSDRTLFYKKLVASFVFNILNNTIEPYHHLDGNSLYYLEQAKFLSTLHN